MRNGTVGLAQVRQRLELERAAGTAFDDACPVALRRVPRQWRDVLDQTAGAWQAAFERRPATDAETALRFVGTDVDGELFDVEVSASGTRWCPHEPPVPACGAPARYCGELCRKRAWNRGAAAA